jgi:hypothetical protein
MVGGFNGSGLFPLNIEKPLTKVVGRIEAAENPSCSNHVVSAHSTPGSTRHLKNAIFKVLLPPLSDQVKNAIENAKKPRRRVNCAFGEVLTEEESMLRLANQSAPKKPCSKGSVPHCVSNSAPTIPCRPTELVSRIPAADTRLVLRKIAGNGSCLFACVAQALFGNQEIGTVAYIRSRAVAFVFEHWAVYESVVKAIHKVSTAGEYFLYMSDSQSFGDQTEIMAISETFSCCIEVYVDGNPKLNNNRVHNEKARGSGKLVRVNLNNEHYDLIEDIIPAPPLEISSGFDTAVPVTGARLRKKARRYSP